VLVGCTWTGGGGHSAPLPLKFASKDSKNVHYIHSTLYYVRGILSIE
jgi:hypothetical protein